MKLDKCHCFQAVISAYNYRVLASRSQSLRITKGVEVVVFLFSDLFKDFCILSFIMLKVDLYVFLYLFFKFLTLNHPGREGVGLEGLQAGRSGASM